MDKNTITGLLLIVVVLIGFSYFNSSNQPAQVAPETATAEEVGQETAAQPQALPAASIDSTAIFAAHQVVGDTTACGETDGKVVLKNDNVTVTISKKGGTISSVSLNNYKSYDDFHEGNDTPLLLYDGKNASMNFGIQSTTGLVNTKNYIFAAVAQKDSTEVTMCLTARDSSALAITYKLLPGDNYMMNVEVKANGMERHLIGNQKMAINWAQKIQQHEKGYDFENQYSTITYKLTGDDTEKLAEHGNEEVSVEGSTDWVAFKNQYFSTVLIAPISEFTDVNLESRQIMPEAEKGYLKNYTASMNVPFDVTGEKATQLQFYFGPNSFNLLKSMDEHKLGSKDYDLEDLVYLGWPLFKWINRFFTIYVFDFLTNLGLPMGIVLLLITLLLRVIVYVPTKKSYMSSAKMRVLRPKMDEIAKKYPNQNDAMKKQQEMMTLYSQYGVSPMGGCLPALIQMPIWIAMFNFVPNAIELRQQGFLWADDLSTYDSILEFGFNIWGIGDHLSLFCLLFCVTNFVYSYMTIRQQRESMVGEQAQQMKVMQWMMYLMPFMFFFMFNKYSAGLNYYYFISLLASSLTMWYLRKRTDDAKLLAQLEANFQANKNDPNKKPKGLAARLEALNKQAAMLEAERNKRNSK